MLYHVLLQKGWNQLKGYYHVIFQACLKHSYVSLARKEGAKLARIEDLYFSPNNTLHYL